MDPALAEPALRVVAHEEVIGPGGVVERLRIGRTRDVRFTAVAELGLVARAAPGAADEKHQYATLRSVRNGSRAMLVDEGSAGEALEAEGPRERMRLPLGGGPPENGAHGGG